MYFIVLLNIRFDGDLNVTLYYQYLIEYLKALGIYDVLLKLVLIGVLYNI